MNAQTSKELKPKNFAEKTDGKQIFYLICKRLFDILGSLVGLFITFPFMCILYIIYQIGDNRGPLFFKQKRIGKDGKPFYIHLFLQ